MTRTYRDLRLNEHHCLSSTGIYTRRLLQIFFISCYQTEASARFWRAAAVFGVAGGHVLAFEEKLPICDEGPVFGLKQVSAPRQVDIRQV